MSLSKGVTPSGSGCQPTASAAEEASSQSGIPNAARPRIPFELMRPRVLQWSMDSGYLTMTYPALITLEEIEEVERVLEIALRTMKRSASAIEARRAETHSGSVEDESEVGATSAETPKV